MKTDYIIIKSAQVIEFVNTVNEICKTIDDDLIGEWLHTHHNFLNNTPLQEFNKNGMVKIFDLLTLIDLDEADIID